MNKRMILYILCIVMRMEAVVMVPAMLIALFNGEKAAAFGFLVAIIALLLCSLLTLFKKPKTRSFFSRESFLSVVAAWIVVAFFGAVPYVVSGAIPDVVDAIFESFSGFSTTGATILTNVEAMPMSLLYWRSFSQWLGGMGVLVFIVALLPIAKNTGHTMTLFNAESPGTEVEKLVPRTNNYAKMLYGLYIGLTVAQFVMLLAGGMSAFESLTTAFSTASTGGFSVLNDSMASYSPYLQNVTTVFMILFGINFNVFFLLMMRDFKKVLKNEELWVYLGILFASIIAIAINIVGVAGSATQAFGQSAFHAASIMTTTGYTATDFNTWPQFSRTILVILMILGASAGSTSGGIKVSRIVLLAKSFVRDVRKMIRPRSVSLVRMNGSVVDEETIRGVRSFFTAYVFVALISLILVSFDNLSVETNITAVVSSLSNVGPGLDLVGPMGNYAGFTDLSKIVLCADMLIGRLEIFPVLLLFAPAIWKRG